jgi:hypothetical protein
MAIAHLGHERNSPHRRKNHVQEKPVAVSRRLSAAFLLRYSGRIGQDEGGEGNNLSTGVIVAIAAGVAVGVTLLVLYIIIATNG